MNKTGTISEQSQRLISAGLDENTADITMTIKIPGKGLNVVRAWSLAKLLTFLPMDEHHDWALKSVGSDGYELKLKSDTDKYKKTVKGNDYVDVVVDGIIYLMKSKGINLGGK